PERPHFVEAFAREIPRYHDRHRLPVGMTGLAQVNGLRGDTSIEERAVFDNHYIESWSLWGDIVILLRTVGAVLRPPRSVRMAHHPSRRRTSPLRTLAALRGPSTPSSSPRRAPRPRRPKHARPASPANPSDSGAGSSGS
ncbi:MAG: sugar transferase, partial [Acidimicrobiales bacterium]|nr:sugar transferase [Acidimicrobiales bacterium]